MFGLAANSLGLLADAGHNLTDVAALVIALIAIRLSQRPPTPTYSYGYHRSTILAALVNAAALFAVTSFIAFEAIVRLLRPESVSGGTVLVVASAATLVNAGAALVLYESRVDLNMRAALLHMAGDAAASLGVAAAGLVILITGGFEWLDPVVSIGIAVLIAIEAWRLLHAAVDVLLESTPDDVDLSMLRAAVTEVDGLVDLHDLHVWSLSSGARAMSAHVVIDGQPSLEEAEEAGRRVKDILVTRFAIAHATLEIETVTGSAGCVSDIERHVGD